MQTLPRLLQQKTFYFAYFLFALCFAFLLICTSTKISCFVLLNTVHVKWLDVFFSIFTFLGDGIFSIAIAVSIFFIKKLRRLSIYIITAYLISGITAQVLKRLFNAPRPKEILDKHVYSFFIDGVTGSGWDSFPSGHTTSVFALATVLALYTNNKRWGTCFLLVAILVGYSRIYLGQHFLEDVVAGAVLGAITGLLVYISGYMLRRAQRKTTGVSPVAADDFYGSRFAGNSIR